MLGDWVWVLGNVVWGLGDWVWRLVNWVWRLEGWVWRLTDWVWGLGGRVWSLGDRVWILEDWVWELEGWVLKLKTAARRPFFCPAELLFLPQVWSPYAPAEGEGCVVSLKRGQQSGRDQMARATELIRISFSSLPGLR